MEIFKVVYLVAVNFTFFFLAKKSSDILFSWVTMLNAPIYMSNMRCILCELRLKCFILSMIFYFSSELHLFKTHFICFYFPYELNNTRHRDKEALK